MCHDARLRVIAQLSDGAERERAFLVRPDTLSRDIVLVPTASDAAWEVQLNADSDVELAVDSGALELLPRVGSCQRAIWRLPSAKRPDWAVVLAARADAFVGSAVLARPAWTRRRFGGEPGTSIAVVVDGRRFVDAFDGRGEALVAFEVPPGVDRAIAVDSARQIAFELAPPPTTLEHDFVTDDGVEWRVYVDRSGRLDDGVSPVGWTRVSEGVFRKPAFVAPQTALAAPAVAASPSPAPQNEAIGRAVKSAVLTPWRIGAGVTVGPGLLPGALMWTERALSRAPIELAAALPFFVGVSRHTAAGASAWRVTTAAGLVGEVGLLARVGGWSLSPRVGGGIMTAFRFVDATTRRSSLSLDASWAATGALRAAHGAVGAEVRALYTPAEPGLESSPLVFSSGVTWTFGK